jgi:D-arginine dehydrogenase
MAGMSLAAEVAELDARLVARSGDSRRPQRVTVLEREWQFAYHTTGRSAAAFLESYGSAEIRALTRASRPLLDALGAESGTPLLRARPLVWVALADRPDALAALGELVETSPAVRRVDPAGALTLCPALRSDVIAGAAVERGAQDIDVDAMHQGYRRRAIEAGVSVQAAIGVEAGEWTGTGWHLATDRGEFVAGRVVDAAGAWADAVARRLGVEPAGLSPLRRTVAIATTDRVPPTWPLVVDVQNTFYFRPESGGLLVSPADETPSPPCDAHAETEDVALALDRVNEVTTLDLRRVRTSWAGLRTFATDRNPVVGYDEKADGFFWLAGQGGYGIQTAPALARLAAALLLDEAYEVPDLDVERLGPGRLRSG